MLKALFSTLLATAWSFCLARELREDDFAEPLRRHQRQEPGLMSQQLGSLRSPVRTCRPPCGGRLVSNSVWKPDDIIGLAALRYSHPTLKLQNCSITGRSDDHGL